MSEATEKRAHDDAQMRAKFEAWAVEQRNQHGLPYFILWNPDCDEYVDQTTNDAWAGWQASRAQALEEASQAADMARSKFSSFGMVKEAAGAWCAYEEIRALAKSEGEI